MASEKRRDLPENVAQKRENTAQPLAMSIRLPIGVHKHTPSRETTGSLPPLVHSMFMYNKSPESPR